MDVNLGVEEILVRADRRVLRLLAPPPRCVIMALRLLRGGGKSVEELEAAAEGYGLRCTRVREALGLLERSGFVECSGGACRLTEEGSIAADTLHDFLEGVRSFAYRAVEGSVGDSDVLGEVMTATASALGLVEAYVEEPSLAPLYLSIHLYVSGVAAMVLAELARINPEVEIALRTLLEQE